MYRILWICWDVGGNFPANIKIAKELAKRGHEVTFLGRPQMIEKGKAAGVSCRALRHSYTDEQQYPPHRWRDLFCLVSSPKVGQELREIVADEKPDLVIIDPMYFIGLEQARSFACPTILVSHTMFCRTEPAYKGILELFQEFRAGAGFPRFPSVDVLLSGHECIIDTTLDEFDVPKVELPSPVLHVGPTFAEDHRNAAFELPWPKSDKTPLILASFSSSPEQATVELFQRTLDAVAPLPVHLVVTTAGTVPISSLKVPANAVVVEFASHRPIMQRASMVITHGGHGTAMFSLAHGLPMVCIPLGAHDQITVGATVESWGAGRALAGEASTETIRTAVEEVLKKPSFRESAERFRDKLATCDGARDGAIEIEKAIAAAKQRGFSRK